MKVVPTAMISVVKLVRVVGEGTRSRGGASAPHARTEHWPNRDCEGMTMEPLVIWSC